MKATLADIFVATVTNKDIVVFAQSIDFTPLFAKIEELIGVNVTFETPVLQQNISDNHWVDIHSEDVVAYAGIFAAAMSRVTITNFGGGIYEKDDEMRFWMPVHLHFELKSGGTNGAELFNARYTTADGWTFH